MLGIAVLAPLHIWVILSGDYDSNLGIVHAPFLYRNSCCAHLQHSDAIIVAMKVLRGRINVCSRLELDHKPGKTVAIVLVCRLFLENALNPHHSAVHCTNCTWVKILFFLMQRRAGQLVLGYSWQAKKTCDIVESDLQVMFKY